MVDEQLSKKALLSFEQILQVCIKVTVRSILLAWMQRKWGTMEICQGDGNLQILANWSSSVTPTKRAVIVHIWCKERTCGRDNRGERMTKNHDSQNRTGPAGSTGLTGNRPPFQSGQPPKPPWQRIGHETGKPAVVRSTAVQLKTNFFIKKKAQNNLVLWFFQKWPPLMEIRTEDSINSTGSPIWNTEVWLNTATQHCRAAQTLDRSTVPPTCDRTTAEARFCSSPVYKHIPLFIKVSHKKRRRN